MTGKFHRPTPASVRNAFERDDTPTVFSSRKERGRAQAQQSLTMTAKGQAAIAAAAEGLNKIIRGRK